MRLPYAFPLKSINAPKTQEIGRHLFGVLELLWNAPIQEVRAACLSAIRDADFHQNTYKAFQSNTKQLEENHLLVQRSTCALILNECDVAVIVRLLESYLEHSYKAWQNDWAHLDWREQEGTKLASEIMFGKAVRFALRLLVIKQPQFLKLGKLDSNVLYCDVDLLDVLLCESRNEILLVSTAIARCLWNYVRTGRERLDEDTWEVFEKLFRFGIEPAGKLHYSLFPYHKYLQKIAFHVRNGNLTFAKDCIYGGLLEARARYICEKYLEAVPVT